MEMPDITSINLFLKSAGLSISDHTIWAILGAVLINELNTIIAGIVALIAGRWAYKAATKNTKYQQHLNMKRVLAYTQSMLCIVGNLKKNIEDKRKQSTALKSTAKKNLKSKLKEKIVTDSPIVLPKEINSKDWEDHALLEERETELILNLSTDIVRYNEDMPHPSEQLKHIDKFYTDTKELEGLLKKSFDEKKKG